VNFRECQEAVPVPAVVDKSRLQRGFDPGYLGEVDIASKLALVDRFEVEVVNLVSVDHDHPGLLRVGGVDEHLLCHVTCRPPATGAGLCRAASG